MVSATVGSPTNTGWKRRSSAASFSMCVRYSSSVVAPTARSSPRASIGLRRFPAETAPSAAPAPTIVWSSSMKRMICPSLAVISCSTAFRRSSNSPRYFAPATSAPTSSAQTRLPFSPSGTSPATIRWASPSGDRCLTDPRLTDQHGVVFVRRESTWIVPGSPRRGRSRDRASPALRAPSGRARTPRAPDTSPRVPVT